MNEATKKVRIVAILAAYKINIIVSYTHVGQPRAVLYYTIDLDLWSGPVQSQPLVQSMVKYLCIH